MDKKLRKAEADRDYYRVMWDLAEARIEELEEELQAAKGQLQNLIVDRTYEVA